MIASGLYLLGGGVLLYFGAEWFVGGASALALALRVPQLLVGLTIVAYGTSAPEAIVGIQAAASGHGDVALANVLGSNIANVGLILGIAALIQPARVDGALRRRELPVLLASALLIPLLLSDGLVSRIEGALLLLLALAYTSLMIAAARSSAALAQAGTQAAVTLAAADIAGAPSVTSKVRAGAVALVGLLVLLLGGRIFVDSAVALARELGLSERLVGLTIVAVGTSLPELVTSVIAATRRHSDIAVGNVVGSNIFNVLLCLSVSALTGRVGQKLEQVGLELAAFLLMSGLAALWIRSERTITRLEGGASLALYLGFMALTIALSLNP